MIATVYPEFEASLAMPLRLNDIYPYYMTVPTLDLAGMIQVFFVSTHRHSGQCCNAQCRTPDSDDLIPNFALEPSSIDEKCRYGYLDWIFNWIEMISGC
jgi:hypothetical protein